MRVLNSKNAAMVLALMLANTPMAYAQEDESSSKEEGNRNVMLNAASANGPREIQIGLPSADVNVLENGMPVTYATNPHSVNTIWRSDASLSYQGLLKITETAITTGNIGYAVNSFTQKGQNGFGGTLNYKTNHFGMQEFSLNANGSLPKDWFYSASMYQDFDPGTFKIRSTPFQDRTQIYKALITKRYGGQRGEFTAMYKYSNSHNVYNYATQSAPFIYVGDGSVKELDGFKLGTSSYAPAGGTFTYMDILDGKMKTGRFGDFTGNKAHELALLYDYRFADGTEWSLHAKYMNAPEANYVDFGGSTISRVTAADNLLLDNGSAYEGLVEGRRTWLHFGKVQNALLTTELKKQMGNHGVRLGLNEWFYHLDYHSSSFQWTATATETPEILTRTEGTGSTKYRGFNELSPEYTKGYENKLALYFTDNWQVSPKFRLLYGGRLEYYRMSADQIPFARYAGFHIGDTHTYTDSEGNSQTVTIAPHRVVKDKLNYAATVQATYNLTRQFGLTADATVATRFPKISDYAGTGPTEAQYKRVSIPLLRGGVFFKNDWIDVTSMITYISKTNNIDQQNVTKPGTTQSKTTLLIYNIQTLGWTTSAEIDPFKGFHLHALFTYQKPTYDNYFIKSPFEGVPDLNANGNIVKEIPQILAEIDPSYQITPDLRLWLSFRYFGKTYANLTDALYFKGRWETFGGVNWTVNKHLTLGASVVNFLNQKGASGTINGTELLGKEEAAKYNNYTMSGNYLRPFTFELSASIKF